MSFAFGLTMAYAIGHISGRHLNSAVAVGLMVGKRFLARDLPGHIGAQVVGAIPGTGVLYFSSPAERPVSTSAASPPTGTEHTHRAALR
jgi:glycerol uptake facilitator-like aquaporin